MCYNPFESLPEELLVDVLYYLSYDELFSLSRNCPQYRPSLMNAIKFKLLHDKPKLEFRYRLKNCIIRGNSTGSYVIKVFQGWNFETNKLKFRCYNLASPNISHLYQNSDYSNSKPKEDTYVEGKNVLKGHKTSFVVKAESQVTIITKNCPEVDQHINPEQHEFFTIKHPQKHYILALQVQSNNFNSGEAFVPDMRLIVGDIEVDAGWLLSDNSKFDPATNTFVL